MIGSPVDFFKMGFLQHSVFFIPATLLSGNPVFFKQKHIPDKDIRG